MLSWVCRWITEAIRAIRGDEYEHYWLHFRLTVNQAQWESTAKLMFPRLSHWVINVLKWASFHFAWVEATVGFPAVRFMSAEWRRALERWQLMLGQQGVKENDEPDWHKWKLYLLHATITQLKWPQMSWQSWSSWQWGRTQPPETSKVFLQPKWWEC